MAKKLIEEGQEIFVCRLSSFFRMEPPNLKKWVVVKTNKSSFYANPEDSKEDKHPTRFSQKDLSGSDTFSNYRVYLTEMEYWEMIERRKEKAQLRKELKNKVDKMPLNELRGLKEQLN